MMIKSIFRYKENGCCPDCGGDMIEGFWHDMLPVPDFREGPVPQGYGRAVRCSVCGQVFSARGLPDKELLVR